MIFFGFSAERIMVKNQRNKKNSRRRKRRSVMFFFFFVFDFLFGLRSVWKAGGESYI